VDGPELFVVCKNCGSEVSPYVTECPYCGQRVRRRAPELGSEGPPPRARRGIGDRLPRLRKGEIPGIAPDKRPTVTILLIALAVIATLVMATGTVTVFDVGLIGPPGDEWWRMLTTPFVMQQNLAYLFITMVVVGIFGMHLERRFGPLVPLLVFAIAAVAGGEATIAAGAYPAFGANGAALGMLMAWLVEDRVAARRGEDRGNDIVGVLVLAVAVALFPLVDITASFAVAVGGAVAGVLFGIFLSLFRR
jgi:membrane associated rhomboid family serine protease